MNNKDMITIRNKKTGEVKIVSRSKFVEKNTTKGLSGIGEDIASSFESAPNALGEMLASIPSGAANVGRYATSNNPLKTIGNLGAGGLESAAGLISSPQVLTRYLSEKFPGFGKAMERGKTPGVNANDPTIYESLMNAEKKYGLSPENEEAQSVRSLGGLLAGGGALSKLPGMASRVGALSGESAGRGGDPLHAALLGVLGEGVAKAPWKKTKELPGAAKNIMKNMPELAGQATASGLETIADYGSKIPMAGEILQPTLGALASHLKYRSVKPETLAQRKLFGDIKPEDMPKINERVEAAKRLGLSFLTPSEALLSPFQSAKEADIGRTSAGAKLLYEKGKERVGTEGKAINNLLDTVYDAKELDPKKKAAYDETMTANVPDEFIERQMQRPVIGKAVKKLENNAAYRQQIEEELGVKLGDIKPNSFMYWDMVKRVLGDMGERAKEKGATTTESDILAKTRRSMVNEMDTIKPEYKTARNISERQFTRKKLEKVFDAKDMTLNNFWSFLKSDEKFNNVMKKLDAFPEAQQKLKDIRLLSNDIIPFDESIRTAYKLKRTGMSKERNKLDALKQALDEKYGQEHDVAAVKLMTDPDWLNMLSIYLKNQKGSK